MQQDLGQTFSRPVSSVAGGQSLPDGGAPPFRLFAQPPRIHDPQLSTVFPPPLFILQHLENLIPIMPAVTVSFLPRVAILQLELFAHVDPELFIIAPVLSVYGDIQLLGEGTRFPAGRIKLPADFPPLLLQHLSINEDTVDVGGHLHPVRGVKSVGVRDPTALAFLQVLEGGHLLHLIVHEQTVCQDLEVVACDDEVGAPSTETIGDPLIEGRPLARPVFVGQVGCDPALIQDLADDMSRGAHAISFAGEGSDHARCVISCDACQDGNGTGATPSILPAVRV